MNIDNFSDIKKLKTNRIEESDILDYKKQIIDDIKLIRHVSSFANAKGGQIIFGIEEERKGGPPKNINGIPEADLNKERIEQIILSNIYPRLVVSIKKITNDELTGNAFLRIEIPNSHLKPHMIVKNRENKFYIRRNFQADVMDEIEVADAYKRRFQGYEDLNKYIKDVKNSKYTKKWEDGCKQIGHFIIIPTTLGLRMIKSTDDFSWIDELPRNDFQPNFPPQEWFIPSFMRGSSNGVIYIHENPEYFRRFLELHRNGCIDYIDDFGYKEERSGNIYFNYQKFISRLLQLIQFSKTLYSRYNYFGDVQLFIWLSGIHKVFLYPRDLDYPLIDEISISRECPIDILDKRTAKEICDEVWNNFRKRSCNILDENGSHDPSLFR